MEFAELIKVPKLDRVILHRAFHKPVEGTLCITGHHVIFSSRKDSREELWILHHMVDCIERKIGQASGTVILKCKQFCILQMDISGVEECHHIANSIEWLSSLDDPRACYCFFYRAMFEIFEDGWMAFPVETEFAKVKIHTDEWRISHVNKDYSVCPTYPRIVIVPKAIDDDTLITVASFRYMGRFPVFSYFHNDTKAVLMHSSQPLVGTNNKRCKEDEKLLNSVLGTGKRGFIIDTRNQNLAQLARTKGGGVEPEVHYPLWRRVYKSIDRHSVLLDSLCKLIDACNDTGSSMDKWLSRLESSGWLSHVKDVLTCACLIAQCIDQEGASVLVHGGEGIDATLQVCSLAQVILDPDCRTVRGFEALVEREWLQAGHPFATRCQHSAYITATSHTKDQSPVFLMFLDCVYQIHQQFPCSFEFSEGFLIMLFEHAYASQFGTFLGACDKDRSELKLAEKTVSLWSYINSTEVLPKYLNPMYDPNNRVIWPSVAPQSLVLWSGMYLRWICNPLPQLESWQTIGEIREKDKSLRSKVLQLRRQVQEMEREAIEMGLLTAPPVDEAGIESV